MDEIPGPDPRAVAVSETLAEAGTFRRVSRGEDVNVEVTVAIGMEEDATLGAEETLVEVVTEVVVGTEVVVEMEEVAVDDIRIRTDESSVNQTTPCPQMEEEE